MSVIKIQIRQNQSVFVACKELAEVSLASALDALLWAASEWSRDISSGNLPLKVGEVALCTVSIRDEDATFSTSKEVLIKRDFHQDRLVYSEISSALDNLLDERSMWRNG